MKWLKLMRANWMKERHTLRSIMEMTTTTVESGSFLQLHLHFTEEVFDFGNHFKVPKQRPTSNAQRPISCVLISKLSSMLGVWSVVSTRQEGLEPPTDGFGDRYSTN